VNLVPWASPEREPNAATLLRLGPGELFGLGLSAGAGLRDEDAISRAASPAGPTSRYDSCPSDHRLESYQAPDFSLPQGSRTNARWGAGGAPVSVRASARAPPRRLGFRLGFRLRFRFRLRLGFGLPTTGSGFGSGLHRPPASVPVSAPAWARVWARGLRLRLDDNGLGFGSGLGSGFTTTGLGSGFGSRSSARAWARAWAPAWDDHGFGLRRSGLGSDDDRLGFRFGSGLRFRLEVRVHSGLGPALSTGSGFLHQARAGPLGTRTEVRDAADDDDDRRRRSRM
jgi:hypothetical protein